MKPFFVAALALAPLLLACSKTETDPGCSEQVITPVSAHEITPAQVQLANALFVRNNLDFSRVRCVRFLHDSLLTYYPPYAPLVTDHVSVEEYTNGLRIFTNQINYSFRAGVLYFTAGTPTSGTSLNGQPGLSPGQLRSRFFATIAAFDPINNSLASQCIVAEFGYYNLKTSTANPTQNLVKAWKVNVKNRSYPLAYYEDQGGKLIYYDNGIRTFQ